MRSEQICTATRNACIWRFLAAGDDREVLIAGDARRTRSRDEDAQSSDGSNGSRHKRSRIERVVSVGTVLRCVDTHPDGDGNLDDAVGELPSTVHEMTEGLGARQICCPTYRALLPVFAELHCSVPVLVRFYLNVQNCIVLNTYVLAFEM